MPVIAVTPPNRASRVRRLLRIAAIAAAVLVSALAAAPPQGPADPPAVVLPGPGAGGSAAPGDRHEPDVGDFRAARPLDRATSTASIAIMLVRRVFPAQPSPPSPTPTPTPQPDSSTGQPDGSTGHPDGSTGHPDGSAEQPDGSTGPSGPGTLPQQPPRADPPAGTPVPPPVRPPGAGLRAPGADYAWPLHPAPAVAAPFRRPSFRFGRGHRGADLAGAPGQAVLAAREGTVVFAGRVAGRPVVSVDHPDGLRTTYEPVVATVRAGDRLSVGDPLGVLVTGHAGCAVACLHWGVRRGKVDYLDPLVLVRPPRLRLLPPEGP